jgi:hypothetical protein
LCKRRLYQPAAFYRCPSSHDRKAQKPAAATSKVVIACGSSRSRRSLSAAAQRRKRLYRKGARASPVHGIHPTLPRRLSQPDVHDKSGRLCCHQVPNATNEAMITIATKSRVLLSALEDLCNTARATSTGKANTATTVCILRFPSDTLAIIAGCYSRWRAYLSTSDIARCVTNQHCVTLERGQSLVKRIRVTETPIPFQ